MTRLKIVNPEPNITDRTFPRSLEEVVKINPEWRELNASEAQAWSGPFDEHGIKHKKDYTWFWLAVWFIACVFGTMVFMAWLQQREVAESVNKCLEKQGQGALPIFDRYGFVVDCKRRR